MGRSSDLILIFTDVEMVSKRIRDLPNITQLEVVGQHRWTVVSEMSIYVLKHWVKPRQSPKPKTQV